MTAQQQWDIASGVGVTAVAVAAGRARETQRADRLMSDPYAEALVHAANLPVSPLDVVPQDSPLWADAMTYMGLRSRFFDEYFQRACADGAKQAVILASGLDTRAYRLPWPDGTRLFEIDQPKVIEFKDTVLDGMGAQPACERHTIGVDLRDDWASALLDAGFDRNVPTAWLAEGLLPYLPAAAEQRLLDTIHEFSAPGSHLALECLNGAEAVTDFSDDPDVEELAQQIGIDMRTLVNTEERPHPSGWLVEQGWAVHLLSPTRMAAQWGRALSGLDQRIAQASNMLTANL